MKTNKVYFEHANITFSNLDKAIEFFQTAFPQFKIRGEGVFNGRKWVHFGDNDFYLALNQALRTEVEHPNNYNTKGINHLGFVVEDVKSLVERLSNKGYKRSSDAELHPFRTREYFMDSDGNEFEFVEYHSDNAEERNQY